MTGLIALVLLTSQPALAILLPRHAAPHPRHPSCLTLGVSAGKAPLVPTAFLAACVLGNVHGGRSAPSLRDPHYRAQQAQGGAVLGVRMVLPRFAQGLRDILRGGGGSFRREGNEAKYRARPQVGADISFGFAVALSALSVVCVGGSLPFLWSAPAGLCESFWLTRIVVLRALALVYFVAFGVAFTQNSALLGDKGLLPASLYLDRLREQNPSYPQEGVTWRLLSKHPTWLWLAAKGKMDQSLRLTAAVGMLLSAGVFANGGSNVWIQGVLWLLYHSIVTVGKGAGKRERGRGKESKRERERESESEREREEEGAP